MQYYIPFTPIEITHERAGMLALPFMLVFHTIPSKHEVCFSYRRFCCRFLHRDYVSGPISLYYIYPFSIPMLSFCHIPSVSLSCSHYAASLYKYSTCASLSEHHVTCSPSSQPLVPRVLYCNMTTPKA